ncbi:HRAS-like suppressor 3 [Mizuhopecten yessoensis]|uniref:Phospholipid-metabolizing enzyme A-C1 n=1 Tax=Mizuhopecten yessoensis TaxID=6573 RepID=A0A210QU75_MIZYE|nr:HRAS-like suppressor 3 [Mizuhopecten yessoensis]OWF52269.1 Phospholipid-metabolizing enzyme A-C1 [Mizuhopecten yessoensis]
MKGSFRKVKGSLECFSASSTDLSKSLSCVESIRSQKARIKRSLRKRKRGDMIKMIRKGYLHYAIYIGSDKIVDLVADNGGDVSSRNLYETVGDSECAIDNYLDEERSPYRKRRVVQRALLSIADQHIYSLRTYNCEHFATWCRYGYKCWHQPCEVAAMFGAISESSLSSS